MPHLLRELKKFYKANRRDLPWRRTRDPYKILVSEVMLQQTQVERVVPFYERFVAQFPNAKVLAKAPLSKVLAAWSGLGYNRRAKFLHEAAKRLVHEQTEELTSLFLESLPGVGHYTARAISTFAYNRPEVFIETNIRTVFMYHYYSSILQNTRISDTELLPLIEEALKKSRMQPRDFYAALMDYGAHLKRQGIKLNAQSAHYVKQKKFKGSSRELRGQILRAVLERPKNTDELAEITLRKKSEVVRMVATLAKEGMVRIVRGKVSLAR